MEESKQDRVMDSVITHAALAFVHYQQAFDSEFKSVLYHSPVWGKNDMWEDFYYPIFDDLKDEWDTGMNEYLKTLRENSAREETPALTLYL
jgi:hypothetical protein